MLGALEAKDALPRDSRRSEATKRNEKRVEAAAAEEALKRKRAKGWASTWLTGPEGFGGPSGGLKQKFGE